MVVLALTGTILTRMLISDSRFVSTTEAMMDARQSARAGMSALSVELSMVGDSGLVAASPTSITVRAPYAWGMACDKFGAGIVASMLPTDSMMYASASQDGIAWLKDTGAYGFLTGVTVAASTATTICPLDSIQVVPGGSLVNITMPDSAAPGSIIYLFQTIRYQFAPSALLPGRLALWRRAAADPDEELLAPFHPATGFGFYVGSSTVPLAAPPADLTTVSGLELRLFGQSEFTPPGSATPETFELTSRISFLNRAN